MKMKNIHSFLILFMFSSMFLFAACELETGDEQEPEVPMNENDSFSNSTIFDVDIVSETDNFINGSSNYYGFVFRATCLIDISVVNAPVEFRILVYDDATTENEVFRSSYVDPGENLRVFVGPLLPGTHYIVVQPRRNDGVTTDYRLQVIFDCSDTSEPNNSFASATAIPVSRDSVFLGKVLAQNNNGEYEDFDMYKFSVSEYGIAKIRVTAPQQIRPVGRDIEIAFFNEANDATLLEDIDLNSGETWEMLVGPLAPGDHFISINYKGECNCQSDQEYSISVDYDTRDVHEPNDNPGIATPIEANQEYYGMLAHPHRDNVADIDFFKLSPQTSGTYKVVLNGVPDYGFNSSNNPRTYAYFYDVPTGGNNYFDFISSSGGNAAEEEIALEAGRDYFFAVSLQTGSHESDGLYSLIIEPQ